MNIQEIVAQALETPAGLGFTLPDAQAARRFSKAFYALRERRRRAGDTTWDGLAVVLPADAPRAVHLVKKVVVPSVVASRRHAISDAFPLTAAHLPRALRSRGRASRDPLAAEIVARRSP
jgi:hypothetical protein